MGGMSTPNISVIMPAYNAEKYIREAIGSVLSQTFEDWELIVIDDGSIDETPGIVSEFDDPRIIYFRQSNSGEASARNVGLDQARGEYIAFLDADDIYLPNALYDLQIFLAENLEFDAVVSDGYFCDGRGVRSIKLSDVRPPARSENVLESLILDPSVVGIPACTLTRRGIIRVNNLRFDDGLVIGPDWDFWIRLAGVTRFGFLNIPTCMYRVHQSNLTKTSGIKKRQMDLKRIHFKILHSDWFEGLNLETRDRFFYKLLIELLSDQPSAQRKVLGSKPFHDMPVIIRARLWRQIGIERMMEDPADKSGYDCLRQAVHIWPEDLKSRFLIRSLCLSENAAVTSVIVWRGLRRFLQQLRTIGQRKPNSVPAELRPGVDGQ